MSTPEKPQAGLEMALFSIPPNPEVDKRIEKSHELERRISSLLMQGGIIEPSDFQDHIKTVDDTVFSSETSQSDIAPSENS